MRGGRWSVSSAFGVGLQRRLVSLRSVSDTGPIRYPSRCHMGWCLPDIFLAVACRNGARMTCRIPDRVTVLLLVGSIVFLLPGCARYSVEPFPLHDATVSLVWPRPPNPPRIRFLREINGPEQVAPSSGKLERLWELVTGERKQKLPFATPYGLVADNGSVIYVADPSAGLSIAMTWAGATSLPFHRLVTIFWQVLSVSPRSIG